MAPPGQPHRRPCRKGCSADTEPTAVVPDDMDADPDAPRPTETITVHSGGAVNAQFFIPGLGIYFYLQWLPHSLISAC